MIDFTSATGKRPQERIMTVESFSAAFATAILVKPTKLRSLTG